MESRRRWTEVDSVTGSYETVRTRLSFDPEVGQTDRVRLDNRMTVGMDKKKSRKQRIQGGRRTLAASGGDWFACVESDMFTRPQRGEQYGDCHNGSICVHQHIG